MTAAAIAVVLAIPVAVLVVLLGVGPADDEAVADGLAALPGVMPDDITVAVEGSQLHIAAQMRSPAAKDYVIHEWHYGPFERSVELPVVR